MMNEKEFKKLQELFDTLNKYIGDTSVATYRDCWKQKECE